MEHTLDRSIFKRTQLKMDDDTDINHMINMVTEELDKVNNRTRKTVLDPVEAVVQSRRSGEYES